MKKIFFSAIAFCSIVATEITAQEKLTPVSEADMMKAWEAYATPGAAHKVLASDDGTWTEEMTIYMAANDPNPTKATMTAESKMILGGRYQQTTHKGTMMGMPFEGIGLVGYDNASKKIVSTWMDNMGTGIMYMSGAYDGSSNKMELKGEITDPMTGKVKPCRETFVIVDQNTRKMEMFDIGPDGKEYKSMEILMKRKK